MKRQHEIRSAEKVARRLMFGTNHGIIVVNIDPQVDCIWFV